MTKNAQHMRMILTKQTLNVDVLHNTFDLNTLRLMETACNQLSGVIELDIMMLTQISVISIAKDDMNQLVDNLKSINCAVKLKELKIEEFCLN